MPHAWLKERGNVGQKSFVVAPYLIPAILLLGASLAADRQWERRVWENRGQAEAGGSALDLDASAAVAVVTGVVDDGTGAAQWFVRALDRKAGGILWEDRFGPMTFGFAKDVAVEGSRAFVAGWILTPGRGFDFVVRAYDLHSGVVEWSQQVGRGPQCVEERPGFARCVAKALTVHNGRVFVVGHLTRTSARSDFAVLAFDAGSGAQLWESVTDAAGTGGNDYAWGVAAASDRVFVVGETGDFSGLLLRAHDAETGAIEWQQHLPGAQNFTLKDTIAAGRRQVFIGGIDADFRFMVQAYDAATGELRWDDRVGDADNIGQVSALAIGGGDDDEERVFVSGVVGCNPTTFVECELAIRTYDATRGLVWQRADPAAGGDWYAGGIVAGGGRVFVGASELLEDGEYHGTVRSYAANRGGLEWTDSFGETSGSLFNSFVNGLLVRGGGLLVNGADLRPDGSSDFLVRMYRAR
jgi:outer membrane protein assembly factor BamB